MVSAAGASEVKLTRLSVLEIDTLKAIQQNHKLLMQKSQKTNNLQGT
jgi:hypothetical protein